MPFSVTAMPVGDWDSGQCGMDPLLIECASNSYRYLVMLFIRPAIKTRSSIQSARAPTPPTPAPSRKPYFYLPYRVVFSHHNLIYITRATHPVTPHLLPLQGFVLQPHQVHHIAPGIPYSLFPPYLRVFPRSFSACRQQQDLSSIGVYTRTTLPATQHLLNNKYPSKYTPGNPQTRWFTSLQNEKQRAVNSKPF